MRGRGRTDSLVCCPPAPVGHKSGVSVRVVLDDCCSVQSTQEGYLTQTQQLSRSCETFSVNRLALSVSLVILVQQLYYYLLCFYLTFYFSAKGEILNA